MLDKLFKKPTADDLIEELKNKSFNESKVESIVKHLDINHINQNLENFLHIIVPLNRIESVKWLVQKGVNSDEADANGVTPLMLACQYGFIDSVMELLKTTKDIDKKDHDDFSAIEYAVINGRYNIYKKMRPLIKDINRKNKKGQSLLHLAIKANSSQIVDDLYEDEEFKFSKEILFYKNTYSNKEILNSILSKFDSLNHLDSHGRSILFYVVTNGVESEDIFNSLVSSGLNMNHLDKYGNNILFHLIYYIIGRKIQIERNSEDDKKEELINLIELIPVLVESGICTDISNNDDETILTVSAKNNCIDILETLFENDVDIDIQNRKQETALNTVILKSQQFMNVIQLLLDYGANPNIKDINGKNPIEKLIEASLITKNHKKVKASVKKDLDFKADYKALLESVLVNTDTNLTLLNSNGEPYFFEALRYGSIEMVKLLIKHGSDINQVDINGENIIYKYMDENQHFKKELEQKEYHNNLQTIIMMGANVNAKDAYGGITLHKAILDCNTPIIKMLLHGGADIYAIDSRGRHIIHNSIWKNDVKIFKLVYTYNKSLLNTPDKFGVLPINYAAFLGYTDLVLEIMELNGQVNNPYAKKKYIINFLKKFHKNLKKLVENARTKEQRNRLNMLVENMKKEFEVQD